MRSASAAAVPQRALPALASQLRSSSNREGRPSPTPRPPAQASRLTDPNCCFPPKAHVHIARLGRRKVIRAVAVAVPAIGAAGARPAPSALERPRSPRHSSECSLIVPVKSQWSGGWRRAQRARLFQTKMNRSPLSTVKQGGSNRAEPGRRGRIHPARPGGPQDPVPLAAFRSASITDSLASSMLAWGYLAMSRTLMPLTMSR